MSCNDAPSDVGSSLVIDTLNARSISSLDTTIFTSVSDSLNRSVLFNSGSLYIGKTADARATTLIRLTNIPDTLGWISTSNIDSAVMLIRPLRFVIGDSSAASNITSFNVVELNKAFINTDSAKNISVAPRWPDLFTGGITPNPAYFSANALASFSGSIPLKDTMSDISLPFNALGKQSLAAWFVKRADSNLAKQIYGFGFVPDNSCTVIRQFSTQSSSTTVNPFIRVKVYYHSNTNVRDSLTLVSGNDASLIDADQLPSPYLQLQSLTQNEVHLNFDLSSIPQTDALLKAQLIFTLDTSKTSKGNISDDTTCYLLSRFTKDTVSTYGVKYSSYRHKGTNQLIFSNIAQALDQARRYYGGKGQLILLSAGTNMERMAIYDMSSDSTKKPRLNLTFAKRPKLGGGR